jgi:hypothetical protein
MLFLLKIDTEAIWYHLRIKLRPGTWQSPSFHISGSYLETTWTQQYAEGWGSGKLWKSDLKKILRTVWQQDEKYLVLCI